MSSFDFAAILFAFAALIGVGNELTLRLPRPVALLLGSLLLVTLIIGTDMTFGTEVHERLSLRISNAHLPRVLLAAWWRFCYLPEACNLTRIICLIR